MSNENEVTIDVVNYPPSGSEMSLQTIAFGPAGPMRVMLDMDVNDDQSVGVKLTVSNAAEHDELRDFLRDAVELLTTIVEADETGSAIEKALAGVTD